MASVVQERVSRDYIGECFNGKLNWTLEGDQDGETKAYRYEATLQGGVTASLYVLSGLLVEDCNLCVRKPDGTLLVNLRGKLPRELYNRLTHSEFATAEWNGYTQEDSLPLEKAWTALKHLTPSFRKAHLIELLWHAVNDAPIGHGEKCSSWVQETMTHTIVKDGERMKSRAVGTAWTIDFNGLKIKVMNVGEFEGLMTTADIHAARSKGKSNVTVECKPRGISPDLVGPRIEIFDPEGNRIYLDRGPRAKACQAALGARAASAAETKFSS